jgi:hypothetical protein
MSGTEFISYVGDPDFHDGFVLSVTRNGQIVEVVVKGYSGNEYTVRFEGVEEIEMHEPEGMELYALSEMRAMPPLRRFVFAKTDDYSPNSLSLMALDFRVQSKKAVW